MQPKLIVLTGPSGVGKNTIADGLVANQLFQIRPVTKWTTRNLRKGEQVGKEFIHLTTEEFRAKIAAGELLEHNFYHGNYYGLPKTAALSAWQKGEYPLAILDVNGARAIRAIYPDQSILIFLTAPLTDIKERLEKRGEQTPQQIADRLLIAQQELPEREWFDLVVENPADHPEKAVQAIVNYLKTRLE